MEVAHATSGGALVTQLKRAFDLDTLLGGDATVAADEADMAAPEALQSVSAVLAKEIEAAQDLLSAYFDPEQKGAVALDPFVGHLRRIGGTLEMLGLAPLKQLADELLEVTRAILDKRIPNPQTVSMPLAERCCSSSTTPVRCRVRAATGNDKSGGGKVSARAVYVRRHRWRQRRHRRKRRHAVRIGLQAAARRRRRRG